MAASKEQIIDEAQRLIAENKQLKKDVLKERIMGLQAQIKLAEMLKEQAEAELERLNG